MRDEWEVEGGDALGRASIPDCHGFELVWADEFDGETPALMWSLGEIRSVVAGLYGQETRGGLFGRQRRDAVPKASLEVIGGFASFSLHRLSLMVRPPREGLARGPQLPGGHLDVAGACRARLGIVYMQAVALATVGGIV